MGGASLAKIRTLWCGSQPGAPTYLSTNPNPLPWQLPPTPVAGVQEYIPGVVKCRRQKQVLSARASLTGLAGREDLPQRCQVSQHGYRNGRRNSGHRGNGNPPPPRPPARNPMLGEKEGHPRPELVSWQEIPRLLQLIRAPYNTRLKLTVMSQRGQGCTLMASA